MLNTNYKRERERVSVNFIPRHTLQLQIFTTLQHMIPTKEIYYINALGQIG